MDLDTAMWSHTGQTPPEKHIVSPVYRTVEAVRTRVWLNAEVPESTFIGKSNKGTGNFLCSAESTVVTARCALHFIIDITVPFNTNSIHMRSIQPYCNNYANVFFSHISIAVNDHMSIYLRNLVN